jgi:hypothetical protein
LKVKVQNFTMFSVPIRQKVLNSRLSSYYLVMNCARSYTNKQQQPLLKTWTSGLTPVALVLVPRRHFGRGKRIPIFGHATVRSRYPALEPVLLMIVGSLFLICIIDWPLLRNKYGIYIPYFYEAMCSGVLDIVSCYFCTLYLLRSAQWTWVESQSKSWKEAFGIFLQCLGLSGLFTLNSTATV